MNSKTPKSESNQSTCRERGLLYAADFARVKFREGDLSAGLSTVALA